MNRAGRKSNYYSKVEPYFEEIKAWRIVGQTEENIAKLLGVSFRSFLDYKNQFPQLAQVLKESKEKLIGELEHTMFEMALGKVKVKETKKFIKNGKDGKQETRIEETVKEVPPHPTLLIFSLKNLAPDRWKDVHEATFNELQTALDNFKLVSDELEKTLDDKDK
jgi:hypothetical protein